jgi:LysM repeat protein
VRLPRDRVEAFARAWTRVRPRDRTYGTHVVRFGEDLGDVAWAYRTSDATLRELNDLGETSAVSAGLVLIVPAGTPRQRSSSTRRDVVSVPSTVVEVPGRRRVFYPVRGGESLEDIARFFDVSIDDVRRWNALDPQARLISNMVVQLFVDPSRDLAEAVVLTPDADEVQVLVVGTDAFFEYHETQRERFRLRYVVQPGDTLRSIADRFGSRIGDMARINRFSRRTNVVPGQEVVVYADPARLTGTPFAEAAIAARRGAAQARGRAQAGDDTDAGDDEDTDDDDDTGGDDSDDGDLDTQGD